MKGNFKLSGRLNLVLLKNKNFRKKCISPNRIKLKTRKRTKRYHIWEGLLINLLIKTKLKENNKLNWRLLKLKLLENT